MAHSGVGALGELALGELQQPLRWGMFSEPPIVIRKAVAQPLVQAADMSFLQIAYNPRTVGRFSESPTVKLPRQTMPSRQWNDISFLQIAYNPRIWGAYSESPTARTKPAPSLVPWAELPMPPTVVPVTVPALFSESPVASVKPFRVAFERTGFDDTFQVILQQGPVFSESPFQLFRTRPWLMQWVDISFLQIAYNPFSWGQFSESPVVTKNSNRPLLPPSADIAFLQIAYTPSAWGRYSESPYSLVKPFRVALERTGWDDTFAPILQQGPVFSESPIRFKVPFLLQQFADISFLQIAYTPGPLVFSEPPIAATRPKAVDQPGFVSFTIAVPTPNYWGMFSESPIASKKPTPLWPWADISFSQISYTPSALTFAESPYALKRPRPFEQQPWWQFPITVPTPQTWGMFSESPWLFRRPTPLYPWTDIAFLQISYTTGPLVFSESQRAFKAAKPFDQQPWVGFVPPLSPTINYWGMFSESPWLFRRPTPLYPWSDIAFLQISYTPGPLVFSESPWAFKAPRPVEQQPFVSFTIAVPTPSTWGMFSESQWWFRRPFQLNPFADISFVQIAYTPALWGMFSESPYQLKKPTPGLLPFIDLPTLPISLIPLVFSESPWQFNRPFQLKQWSDISWLQIAYTPSNWGAYSESPYRIRGPLSPALMQAADIAFLQIAYTPSALVFAESQWTNRNVTQWKQRLDQPGLMPNVPPTAAATPSALVFSESPTHVTARWMGAAMLSQEGMWGWAFPPPIVIQKVWEWHIRYRRRGRR
jgi:hypothetical protein